MMMASRHCDAKFKRESIADLRVRSIGTPSWSGSSAQQVMRSVVIRPEAEVDIEVIADYTITQWGAEQARHYVGELRRAIERLAVDGLRRPEEAERFQGRRRARGGHHSRFTLLAADRKGREWGKIGSVRVGRGGG